MLRVRLLTREMQPEPFQFAREILEILRRVIILIRVKLQRHGVCFRRYVLCSRHNSATMAVFLCLLT